MEMTPEKITELKKCAGSLTGPEVREILDSLEAQAQEITRLQATNQRLADLVRYKRHDLHNDGLISDEEYGKIMQITGAVNRLEGYAAAKAKFKAEITRLQGELERERQARKLLAELTDGIQDQLQAERDQHAETLRGLREAAHRIPNRMGSYPAIEEFIELIDSLLVSKGEPKPDPPA